MPRHKLDVIKILSITAEPVQSVSSNVLGPFQNFSRKGSKYKINDLVLSDSGGSRKFELGLRSPIPVEPF